MATVKNEAEIEQSIARLCARVVSASGLELQKAIIDLSIALKSWRSIRMKNGSEALQP